MDFMKIGINATILDEKPTGLGTFTINIIKELSILINDKDSIIVYTSVPSIFDGYPVTVKKVSSVVQPQNGKLGGLMRFLWSQFIFPLRLKKDKIDILYSTTHHGLIINFTKQIITIHDILPLKYPYQYKLQYYYFKFILPMLAKRSKKIITVSNNTKKDLVSYYHISDKMIDVIYNSFDKEHFSKVSSNEYKEKFGDYLLFVGASYPHKNLERAIKGFISSGIDSKYKLIVVGGRENYKNWVKQQFSKQQLKNVYFIDYVNYEKLPILYSNAKALIYPSLYEGFGIPPLEAMASGCPVIASNTSSIPEVCQDAAFYFNPEDISEISNAIRTVLNNDNLKEELIQKGFKRVNQFSWRESAKKLLEIILED
jgi:glycosyltransferase involved in cell wall biosynthesis